MYYEDSRDLVKSLWKLAGVSVARLHRTFWTARFYNKIHFEKHLKIAVLSPDHVYLQNIAQSHFAQPKGLKKIDYPRPSKSPVPYPQYLAEGI